MVARGHPATIGSEDGIPVLPSVRVAFVPGPVTDLLSNVTTVLQQEFVRQGHVVSEAPDAETDLVITTAPFGTPTPFRKAVLFQLRRKYGVAHKPVVYTLTHATTREFESWLDHFEVALKRDEPDPDDYRIEGLASSAYRVLHEQGKRGGPILALERAVQAQVKSVRVVLVVGDASPHHAFHFDLVGAYPDSTGDDIQAICEDIVLRMATTVSTEDVASHESTSNVIPSEVWRGLETPDAMIHASAELNRRGFFTEPVFINDLVRVHRSIGDTVAEQYSEGCFATWDPGIGGLVATISGSIRPVHKGHVTREDLSVIVGVRPGGMGAFYRPIEGLDSSVPSSEGVELMAMDEVLPRTGDGEVPILRSKLHGHRGVGAFAPDMVEFVPLHAPYYDYLVSCASDAQALGVKEAFSRSAALRDPDDPRQVVFTVLPGHGVMIAEKWQAGREPFQTIWEAMDDGGLEVTSRIPQGRLHFTETGGRMVLRED